MVTPRDRLRLVEMHDKALNLSQLRQGLFRREIAPGQFEPLAHQAADDQGQKRNKRMRSDSVRQPVLHGRNLDLRLEHPEASRNVCQACVALDPLWGAQVRYVGCRQQLAFHPLDLCQGSTVDCVAQQGDLQIGIDGLCQMHLLGHGRWHAFGMRQALKQRIHLVVCFGQASKGGEGALKRASSLIAVGRYPLQVGVAAKSGQLDELEGNCRKTPRRTQPL